MLATSLSFVYTEKIVKGILLELQLVAVVAVEKLKLTKLDISVVFVGASKIRQLNKLYRKKDKVTDVLSFFYGNEGEVFVCLKQAGRQAKQHKVDLREELVKLIIHGLTHIAGYDHEKAGDYKKMSKVEKDIYDLYQKNNQKY